MHGLRLYKVKSWGASQLFDLFEESTQSGYRLLFKPKADSRSDLFKGISIYSLG